MTQFIINYLILMSKIKKRVKKNMNLKKVVAGSMATIMAGSSIGFAADLSDFPEPFVSEGNGEFLAVYGADAKVSDGLELLKIVNSISSGSSASTSGEAYVTGEGQFLNSQSDETIRWRNGLAETFFSDQQFPTLLKSGTVQADKDYKYNQSVEVEADLLRLLFQANKDALEEDPEYLLVYQGGNNLDSTNYVLKTIIDFDTPLDLEDDGIGSAKIELFGKEYSISNDSTHDKLVLLQASNKILLTQGEDAQIDVDGKNYNISLIITDENDGVEEATIIIDGKIETIEQGESKEIIDGVEISILNINHIDPIATIQRPDLASTVEISVGTNKIVLENDSEVTIGQDEDQLRGTKVIINSSPGAGNQDDINVIEVVTRNIEYDEDEVTLVDSVGNFIGIGEEFVDPVWTTLRLSFTGLSQDVLSTGTETKVSRFGDDGVKLESTHENGKNIGLVIAEAFETGDTSNPIDVKLGASISDNGTVEEKISIIENEVVSEDDFVFISSKRDSTILEVQSIRTTAGNEKVIVRDLVSGDKIDFENFIEDPDNNNIKIKTKTIQKISITAAIDNNTTDQVQFTWGSEREDVITVFPAIYTENDGLIAVMDRVDVGDINNLIELPNSVAPIFASRVNTGGVINTWIDYGRDGTEIFPLDENGNPYTNPVVVVWDDDKDNVVIIEIDHDETDAEIDLSNIEIRTIRTSGFITLDSNNDKRQSVTRWGTLIEQDTESDTVSVYYPKGEVYANVSLLGPGATATEGVSVGFATKVQPVSQSLAVADNSAEYTNGKNTKNLICIGGPVVNKCVSDLAAAGKTKNTEWYRQQGQGEYLINYIEDGFAEGNAVLVIAGHSANDTTNAVDTLLKGGLTGTEKTAKGTEVADVEDTPEASEA